MDLNFYKLVRGSRKSSNKGLLKIIFNEDSFIMPTAIASLETAILAKAAPYMAGAWQNSSTLEKTLLAAGSAAILTSIAGYAYKAMVGYSGYEKDSLVPSFNQVMGRTSPFAGLKKTISNLVQSVKHVGLPASLILLYSIVPQPALKINNIDISLPKTVVEDFFAPRTAFNTLTGEFQKTLKRNQTASAYMRERNPERYKTLNSQALGGDILINMDDLYMNVNDSMDTLKVTLSNLSRFADYIAKSQRRHFGHANDNTGKSLLATETSGDPKALSWVGAGGLGQFMEPTAKDMGMVINDFIDQRFNPRIAIDKCFDYLMRLKHDLGELYLADVAYNWGPGMAGKVKKKYGYSWAKAKPGLNSEPKNHAIRFMTRRELFNHPELYPPIEFEIQPLFSETLDNSHKYVIRRGDNMEQIAYDYGVTLDNILELNPEIINPDKLKYGYTLYIPDIIGPIPATDRLASR